MTIALETIVKGNIKRTGYVMNVDALALDDRMVELQSVFGAIDNTLTDFNTEMKELVGADVVHSAKQRALIELLSQHEDLPDAIASLTGVFTESMFFKSPAKVEELAKQRRRYTTLVNKIKKQIDTK